MRALIAFAGGSISVALFGCGGNSPTPAPPGPTPAPTPAPPTPPTPPTTPCNKAEWDIVLAIATNQKFWACDEKNGCWDGLGNMNKQCEIKCLEAVDISTACADCAVDCTSHDCTHCYDGPTPAPTPPAPTPGPTPFPCTSDDWQTVKSISNNPLYQKCATVNGCYGAYGRVDELCVAFCLGKVVSKTCASCVAERSGAGDWGECASGATPEPTTRPCTEDEWETVTSLEYNTKYLMCDESLGCFDAFAGEVNKHCIETCLQAVGCAPQCAACVMGSCFPGKCDECHPTPAPTPVGPTPCSTADWAVVSGLSTNTAYLACEAKNCESIGPMDKACLVQCMVDSGCGNHCAVCVTKFCHGTYCPQCHPSTTATLEAVV